MKNQLLILVVIILIVVTVVTTIVVFIIILLHVVLILLSSLALAMRARSRIILICRTSLIIECQRITGRHKRRRRRRHNTCLLFQMIEPLLHSMLTLSTSTTLPKHVGHEELELVGLLTRGGRREWLSTRRVSNSIRW